MEMIDVYDANLKLLGTEERNKAHMLGLWHKSFHLWLVSPKNGGQVMYQWRSREMQNFPDMLDISAAGHLLAGEKVSDGLREAQEELGITLNMHDIHNLGYRVEVADQTNGQKNREYQAVHMAMVDADLNQFSPQVEEVAGLYWVPISDGMGLFLDNLESVACDGLFYDSLNSLWKQDKRKFTRNEFLPRIQKYYLTIHIMAGRFLNGCFPLAIS